MFCHAHADQAAVAKCTGCGVLLCGACRHRESGRALCEQCAPARRDLGIRVWPVPPRAPVLAPPAPPAPLAPTPPASPLVPAQPLVPREPRRPRPGLAAALGIVPGLGHCYAGSWGKGLGLLLVAFPVAAICVASGALPAAAYAFGHGVVAFDGYRIARERRGEWTREDTREARGVWIACAAVLALLGLARASGAEVSLWAAWPALLVPLGVGLALGERSNRVDARAASSSAPTAPGAPETPAPAPAPVAPTPTPALKPGESVDRRLHRAARSGELLGV